MPEINDIEIRTIPLTEIRMVEGTEFPIEGFGAVYDQLTDMGWYREKIDPGFFVGRLQDDIRSCFNHNENYVIGRNKANTLKVENRPEGLWFAVKPPDTQYARDLQVSIKRGDVTGCSFMFRTKKDLWVEETDTEPTRTLLECAELIEIGPVTFPAYPQTSVVARMSRGKALLEQIKNDTEIPHGESELRATIEKLERFLDEGRSGPSTSQAAGEDKNVDAQAQVGLEIIRRKLAIMKLR
jgi:uncharacterized protein